MGYKIVAAAGVLGASLVMYAIGRLLLNVSLRREDAGRDDFLCKALAYVSFVFLFLGIIATVIIHIVNVYPDDRMRDCVRKEEDEKHKLLTDSYVRQAVAKEHDSLVSYYTELMRKEREKIKGEESERYRERFREYLQCKKSEEG